MSFTSALKKRKPGCALMKREVFLWMRCNLVKKTWLSTSLVAQWLRIRLPMQGTRVQSLVQEDPTCHGAAKSMRRNSSTCATTTEIHAPRARAPQQEKPPQWEAHALRSLCTATKSSPHSWQLEKAHAQERRPNAAKDKRHARYTRVVGHNSE